MQRTNTAIRYITKRMQFINIEYNNQEHPEKISLFMIYQDGQLINYDIKRL